MVRAITWVLCLTLARCAAARPEREPAGQGPSLLPRDESIEQLFQTEDEAAKNACAWFWRIEPEAWISSTADSFFMKRLASGQPFP